MAATSRETTGRRWTRRRHRLCYRRRRKPSQTAMAAVRRQKSRWGQRTHMVRRGRWQTAWPPPLRWPACPRHTGTTSNTTGGVRTGGATAPPAAAGERTTRSRVAAALGTSDGGSGCAADATAAAVAATSSIPPAPSAKPPAPLAKPPAPSACPPVLPSPSISLSRAGPGARHGHRSHRHGGGFSIFSTTLPPSTGEYPTSAAARSPPQASLSHGAQGPPWGSPAQWWSSPPPCPPPTSRLTPPMPRRRRRPAPRTRGAHPRRCGSLRRRPSPGARCRPGARLHARR